ncbi:MAG: hypothetical protein BWZ10_01259 [candidate division BRC1 bacterium ADurb.BinA364]|nr:MAG: hypothetical protein BWZ10_01259 [candidate division BRC1 bacterium ADurb.BinA364]
MKRQSRERQSQQQRLAVRQPALGVAPEQKGQRDRIHAKPAAAEKQRFGVVAAVAINFQSDLARMLLDNIEHAGFPCLAPAEIHPVGEAQGAINIGLRRRPWRRSMRHIQNDQGRQKKRESAAERAKPAETPNRAPPRSHGDVRRQRHRDIEQRRASEKRQAAQRPGQRHPSQPPRSLRAQENPDCAQRQQQRQRLAPGIIRRANQRRRGACQQRRPIARSSRIQPRAQQRDQHRRQGRERHV